MTARSPFGRGVDAVQTHIRRAIVPLQAVLARVPAGGDLVDLGCGQGLLLDQVLPRVHRVVGVDYDPRKLDMACALLSTELATGKVQLVHADLLQWLAQTDLRFDSALMVDTLSSFRPADQDQILHGAVRILRPGGTLLLKVVDAEPRYKALMSQALSGLVYRVMRLSKSADQRFWYRPSTQLAHVLEHAGCTVERILLHAKRPVPHPIPHVLLIARKAGG